MCINKYFLNKCQMSPKPARVSGYLAHNSLISSFSGASVARGDWSSRSHLTHFGSRFLPQESETYAPKSRSQSNSSSNS